MHNCRRMVCNNVHFPCQKTKSLAPWYITATATSYRDGPCMRIICSAGLAASLVPSCPVSMGAWPQKSCRLREAAHEKNTQGPIQKSVIRRLKLKHTCNALRAECYGFPAARSPSKNQDRCVCLYAAYSCSAASTRSQAVICRPSSL